MKKFESNPEIHMCKKDVAYCTKYRISIKKAFQFNVTMCISYKIVTDKSLTL